MRVGRSDSSQTLQDKVIRRLQAKPLLSYSASPVRQSELNYRAGHKCIDHPLSLYHPGPPRSMLRISKIISVKFIWARRANPIQGGEVRAWPLLPSVELEWCTIFISEISFQSLRGIERTEHTDDSALKGLICVSISLQLLPHLVNYQIQNAEGIAKNVIFLLRTPMCVFRMTYRTSPVTLQIPFPYL